MTKINSTGNILFYVIDIIYKVISAINANCRLNERAGSSLFMTTINALVIILLIALSDCMKPVSEIVVAGVYLQVTPDVIIYHVLNRLMIPNTT